jgi:protein-tyrosine phosphatase
MASKLPKDKFNVDSAGTGSWHIGHSPDALYFYRQKKIRHFKTRRQFNSNDFETYDYIYVMDKSNYDDVIALAQTSEQKKKYKLF